MTKHTPGPWRASGTGVYKDRDCIAMTETDVLAWATNEANAHLIAAAPDLLAACQLVKAWLMDPFVAADADDQNLNPAFRDALKAVHAAIAKVKP